MTISCFVRSDADRARRTRSFGREIWRQLCNLAMRKPAEPRSHEGVILVAGIMFAAIWRENPGAGAFRGVFHWSNPMVVTAIRHGAAVSKNASISAPARQDSDRVVETSIPA